MQEISIWREHFCSTFTTCLLSFEDGTLTFVNHFSLFFPFVFFGDWAGVGALGGGVGVGVKKFSICAR